MSWHWIARDIHRYSKQHVRTWLETHKIVDNFKLWAFMLSIAYVTQLPWISQNEHSISLSSLDSKEGPVRAKAEKCSPMEVTIKHFMMNSNLDRRTQRHLITVPLRRGFSNFSSLFHLIRQAHSIRPLLVGALIAYQLFINSIFSGHRLWADTEIDVAVLVVCRARGCRAVDRVSHRSR